MRTITLEEHYATPGFLNGPGRDFVQRAASAGNRMQEILARVRDVGEARIAEMDAAGIDVQVLSLNSPGVEPLAGDEACALAREANDFVVDAVKRNPSRFAGFAALPIAEPDKAADELERAVRQHGFKGALINGHHRGRYLDDPFFSPILARAESLDVPIYVHPTQPPPAVVEASYSGFRPEVSFMFANAGWGWHIETGVHVLRMILGGVFDRFPKLQVIVGHMGEALPFMLSRVDIMTPEITGLERPNRRVSAGECPLHFQRFQLHADLSRSAAAGGGGPDHVLRRLSLRVDGPGAGVPRSFAGEPGRSRTNRARKCRTPAADVDSGNRIGVHRRESAAHLF